MPGYKGHFFGALLFFGITLIGLLYCQCSLSWTLCGQALFFTLLGGLFPDIDTKSQGQKVFYALVCFLLIGLVAYKKYTVGIVVALLAFIPLFSRHRALFHSLWFAVVIVGALVGLTALQFPVYTASVVRNGAFFLLGVYSHLVLDFGFKKSFRKR